MTDRILDDNLRRLLAAAAPRARLSPEARRRIRTELGSVWEQPQEPPRSAPRPQLVVQKQRWPRVVAAAAALFILAIGAAKLLPSESELEPGGRHLETAAAAQPRLSDGAQAGIASPTEEPGRVAALDPREVIGTDLPARNGQGNDGAVAATAGTGNEASTNVLARVEVPAPDSLDSPPRELTLWVKPVVQLPQVADPVPHVLPIKWTPGLEDSGSSLTANLAVETALEPALAMGADHVLLQVEIAGMAPARALVPIEEASAGTVRFGLEPGIALVGTVVAAADGLPLQGALVVALDQLPLDTLDVGADPRQGRLPQPYAVTDAIGRFTLPHVAQEATVRLRASGGEFAPTIVSVATGNAASTRIELGPGTAVWGVVERPDGSRYDDAVVVVSLSGSDPSAIDRPAMTFGIDQCDANGEYRVEGLPPGNFVALVFDPNDRETPREFRQLRIKSARELRVDFLSPHSPPVVETGLALNGVIVDKDGHPVAAASLSLSSLDGSMAEFSDWRVAATDSDGRFNFQGIDASRYLIHRVLDGFERMSPIWDGRVEASRTLRIVLADTEVQLNWQGATKPGRSWTILERWRPDEAEWSFAGSAPSSQGDALRKTQFDHLPPGRYRAVLLGQDHGATRTDDFEVEAQRPVEATIQLRPGGPLSIRVTGAESGFPIDGVTVGIQDADGWRIPQKETLATDIEGQARQDSVPFERVTVLLRPPGAPKAEAVEVDFTAGQKGPVEIQLPGS